MAGQPSPIITVGVIDPQPLFRLGLDAACADHPQIKVVSSTGTAREGLAAIRTVRPDVTVCSIQNFRMFVA